MTSLNPFDTVLTNETVKIESAIQEVVKEALDSELNAIQYNLSQVFGGLLFSLKPELEKEGEVGDIDTLIRYIVNSSKCGGPENEEYPVWNEKNPLAQAILKRMEKALQNHNIQQAWNIGKKP